MKPPEGPPAPFTIFIVVLLCSITWWGMRDTWRRFKGTKDEDSDDQTDR